MIYLYTIFVIIFIINSENIGYWNYFKRILISFDQFINVLFFAGYEDETLSSRAYRLFEKNNYWYSKYPMKIIDILFFFDTDKQIDNNEEIIIRHCQKSYYYELSRQDLPPEMREL